MPAIPNVRKSWTNTRFKVFKHTSIQLSNVIKEEWVVMGSRTFLIVLNFIISDKIVNEMLQRYARVVPLYELPLKFINVCDVINCCLCSPGYNLLVLEIVFHLLAHITIFHEASFGVSNLIATFILIIRVFLTTAVIRFHDWLIYLAIEFSLFFTISLDLHVVLAYNHWLVKSFVWFVNLWLLGLSKRIFYRIISNRTSQSRLLNHQLPILLLHFRFLTNHRRFRSNFWWRSLLPRSWGWRLAALFFLFLFDWHLT